MGQAPPEVDCRWHVIEDIRPFELMLRREASVVCLNA